MDSDGPLWPRDSFLWKERSRGSKSLANRRLQKSFGFQNYWSRRFINYEKWHSELNNGPLCHGQLELSMQTMPKFNVLLPVGQWPRSLGKLKTESAIIKHIINNNNNNSRCSDLLNSTYIVCNSHRKSKYDIMYAKWNTVRRTVYGVRCTAYSVRRIVYVNGIDNVE